MKTNHDIKLSLIVTTNNRPVELKRLLDSLLLQNERYPIEVVLVNQGPPDETVQKLFSERSWILLESNEVMPLSVARNKALAVCSGELLGFPDDDCWYPADFVNEIIERFEQQPETDAFCVSVYDPISGQPYGNRPRNIVKPITFKNVTQLPVSVGIFVRSQVTRNISLIFNEQLGAGTFYGGGEETAYVCSLLKNKAKVVYDGFLSVYHQVDNYESISLQKVMKYARGYGFIIGNILLERRYEAIPSILYFIAKSLAGMLIRLFKKGFAKMYYTRLKYFFIGINAAYKNKKSIF